MINLHVHVFSVGREGGEFEDRRRFSAAAKKVLRSNEEALVHKEKSLCLHWHLFIYCVKLHT